MKTEKLLPGQVKVLFQFYCADGSFWAIMPCRINYGDRFLLDDSIIDKKALMKTMSKKEFDLIFNTDHGSDDLHCTFIDWHKEKQHGIYQRVVLTYHDPFEKNRYP